MLQCLLRKRTNDGSPNWEPFSIFTAFSSYMSPHHLAVVLFTYYVYKLMSACFLLLGDFMVFPPVSSRTLHQISAVWQSMLLSLCKLPFADTPVWVLFTPHLRGYSSPLELFVYVFFDNVSYFVITLFPI